MERSENECVRSGDAMAPWPWRPPQRQTSGTTSSCTRRHAATRARTCSARSWRARAPPQSCGRTLADSPLTAAASAAATSRPVRLASATARFSSAFSVPNGRPDACAAGHACTRVPRGRRRRRSRRTRTFARGRVDHALDLGAAALGGQRGAAERALGALGRLACHLLRLLARVVRVRADVLALLRALELLAHGLRHRHALLGGALHRRLDHLPRLVLADAAGLGRCTPQTQECASRSGGCRRQTRACTHRARRASAPCCWPASSRSCPRRRRPRPPAHPHARLSTGAAQRGLASAACLLQLLGNELGLLCAHANTQRA